LCSNKILIIIENDIELAARLSLDGVHLTNGQKSVKKAKLLLSENQVVGAFCGLSKHSALVAAEHGADYIAFNASYRSSQKTEEIVELFKWWSEFIEIPVMGECQNDYPISRRIWNHCDFFSIGDKVWQPESAVNSFSEPYEFEY
jgi:thiamine-phosphate pyrophosphorylase